VDAHERESGQGGRRRRGVGRYGYVPVAAGPTCPCPVGGVSPGPLRHPPWRAGPGPPRCYAVRPSGVGSRRRWRSRTGSGDADAGATAVWPCGRLGSARCLSSQTVMGGGREPRERGVFTPRRWRSAARGRAAAVVCSHAGRRLRPTGAEGARAPRGHELRMPRPSPDPGAETAPAPAAKPHPGSQSGAGPGSGSGLGPGSDPAPVSAARSQPRSRSRSRQGLASTLAPAPAPTRPWSQPPGLNLDLDPGQGSASALAPASAPALAPASIPIPIPAPASPQRQLRPQPPSQPNSGPECVLARLIVSGACPGGGKAADWYRTNGR